MTESHTMPTLTQAAAPSSTVPAGTTRRAEQQPGWQGVFQPGAAGNGPQIQMARTKVHATQRVFLLLDDSGSMSGAKALATNAAANALLGHLSGPGFRDGFLVSLITFDDEAQVHNDHARASDLLGKAAVSGRGGTDVAAALRAANLSRAAWQRNPALHEVAAPVFLLMSDGCTTNSVAAQREADVAKAEGVVIVAVGFGSDADRGFLQAVATSPAHFRHAATAEDLTGFFAQVGATLRDSQRSGADPANALARSLRAP